LSIVTQQPSAPPDVLSFWFAAPPESEAYGRARKQWFEKDVAFDAAVAECLGPLHDEAAAGKLDGWATGPRGALALVILLDQVPRNIFRGVARAFMSDEKARSIAETAIARGFDGTLLPVERMFLYLPFEHSEAIADQLRSLELSAALGAFPETQDCLQFARRHHEIIRRFGRFPHRNAALGRATTPEEAAFLAEPNSNF
jgi:uncharacterized protein (DUF924 family)